MYRLMPVDTCVGLVNEVGATAINANACMAASGRSPPPVRTLSRVVRQVRVAPKVSLADQWADIARTLRLVIDIVERF
jgi:hypothetical protein